MELDIGVDNVMKSSKGKIILEYKKKEDRAILTRALKENLGEHYKVYTPNKKITKDKSDRRGGGSWKSERSRVY